MKISKINDRPSKQPPQSPAPLDARIQSLILPFVLAVWWVGFGCYYYNQYGYNPIWRIWPEIFPDLFATRGRIFLDHVTLACGLAFMAFIGYGTGRLILRFFDLADDFPGLAVLSIAIGWGIIGWEMLLLGLIRCWNSRILTTLAIVGGCLAIFGAFLDFRDGGESKRIREKWSTWQIVLAILLTAFAAFNFIGTFIPELFYDALVYHLGLPQSYWQHGGILPTPENLYSGLPMQIQMLYSAALPWGGDSLAHLLHWALGLGTLWFLYSFCLFFMNRSAALLAAVLFYSTPLVGVLSWKSAAELGWAFYQTASVFCLGLYLKQEQRNLRWVALAGLLAGFAMGTKYQAWPMIFVLTPALGAVLPAEERRKCMALFVGVALCGLIPWIVKDILLYGNPLYPFLQERFNPVLAPHWRDLLIDGGKRDISAMLTTWGGLKSYLRHPWALTFQNNDINNVGPVLLLGLPLLFAYRCTNATLRFAWFSCLGLWIVWSLTSTNSRFFVPTIPLACAVFAAAIETGLPGWLRAGVRGGVIFISLASLFCLTTWIKTYDAERVLTGSQSREEYLAAPHPSYARYPSKAVEFINERLERNAKVLFVGEARGYYCRREHITATIFDEAPLLGWLAEGRDVEGLRAILRRQRITHVLLNVNELEVWKGSAWRYLVADSQEGKLLRDFLARYGKPVFEQKDPPNNDYSWSWAVLYELPG